MEGTLHSSQVNPALDAMAQEQIPKWDALPNSNKR